MHNAVPHGSRHHDFVTHLVNAKTSSMVEGEEARTKIAVLGEKYEPVRSATPTDFAKLQERPQDVFDFDVPIYRQEVVKKDRKKMRVR